MTFFGSTIHPPRNWEPMMHPHSLLRHHGHSPPPRRRHPRMHSLLLLHPHRWTRTKPHESDPVWKTFWTFFWTFSFFVCLRLGAHPEHRVLLSISIHRLLPTHLLTTMIMVVVVDEATTTTIPGCCCCCSFITYCGCGGPNAACLSLLFDKIE